MASGDRLCCAFFSFYLQVFLAFIPGQALMVACGYLYGFSGGFLLSWLSLAVGGEVAFILARRCGRSFAEKWISANVLARWDKSAEGVGFFTLSLVMSLVPNDAMCYAAGLGKISHLEAAASGLPLVGVHATCIPEIVYDGVNGYLTKAGDVYAMSQSMIRILNDPHRAASMGRVSRTLAEGHPNQETFDEHERIYHQMVREQGTQKIPARVRAYFQWKQFKERFIWVRIDRFW
ncbi:MAG: VTT domain-containing protein [Anaerolineae bacterium]|nr:VTT domain-containing protein [Anaerolineae bacterium]